ncbi:hypothetical protein IE81DRAFT_360531 [Ceraceosorus guamensis]|uniref:Uncharacterized protein n=1 Tax=Ceraceosorus guamensis TaxID=1522189 RepID=A0A316WC82_9BASI|nr:hypothetical protein IE81DRAFT_360531 [Ceraceosorus guamensis]PWN45155.1 hypothetical protein IE81DRAFT_360531 [Ceraceosorus guamensis]
MKYGEHQASVMVDGKALEEFNVEHTYDKNTNTHTCTAEIAYTHNANFITHHTYSKESKDQTVTYFFHICTQDAGQREGYIKGFRTASHGYKPFRWSRLAHRADFEDETSTSSLPLQAGTIKLHIEPRKNLSERPAIIPASDGPLDATGLQPSKGMIKPALVGADAEVAQKTPLRSFASDYDPSRPVVVMIWKYMLRDLIVDRSQGSRSATLGAPSSSSASNHSAASNAQSPVKRKRELDEEAEQLQSRWAAIKQERLQLRETTANVKPEAEHRVRSRAGSNASVQSVPPPVRERTGQSISIDLTELDDDDE